MLAQRGIEVSYEAIRCWTIKFGPQIARNLKRKRPAPSPRWHLDEVVCTIAGSVVVGTTWNFDLGAHPLGPSSPGLIDASGIVAAAGDMGKS